MLLVSNVDSVSEQLTLVNDQVLLSPNEKNVANAVPVEDRRMCEDEEGRKEVEQVARGEDNKDEIGV